MQRFLCDKAAYGAPLGLDILRPLACHIHLHTRVQCFKGSLSFTASTLSMFPVYHNKKAADFVQQLSHDESSCSMDCTGTVYSSGS